MWNNVVMVGECWEWFGYRMSNGYGEARHEGKRWRVHRLAYFLTHGAIPEGLNILHTCDNSVCVNPAHLYAGTQQQNIKDRDDRGRWRGYERTPEHRAALSRLHKGKKMSEESRRKMAIAKIGNKNRSKS